MGEEKKKKKKKDERDISEHMAGMRELVLLLPCIAGAIKASHQALQEAACWYLPSQPG